MPCCIKFKHALQTILYVYLFCSLRRWNQVVLKSYHVKIQGTCWVEWLRRTLRKPGNARECLGTFVECPGVGKECPEEITLIITLVTNKNHLFYERLNYSCKIWHCKYCSGNAGCHKRMPGSRKRMPGVKLRK